LRKDRIIFSGGDLVWGKFGVICMISNDDSDAGSLDMEKQKADRESAKEGDSKEYFCEKIGCCYIIVL
jgi:hypothetical protein